MIREFMAQVIALEHFVHDDVKVKLLIMGPKEHGANGEELSFIAKRAETKHLSIGRKFAMRLVLMSEDES